MLQPGTEAGCIVTPLPWPHSTNGALRSKAIPPDTTPSQENLTTTTAPMKLNQSKDYLVSVIVKGTLFSHPLHFSPNSLITVFAVVCQALNSNYNDKLSLAMKTTSR